MVWGFSFKERMKKKKERYKKLIQKREKAEKEAALQSKLNKESRKIEKLKTKSRSGYPGIKKGAKKVFSLLGEGSRRVQATTQKGGPLSLEPSISTGFGFQQRKGKKYL